MLKALRQKRAELKAEFDAVLTAVEASETKEFTPEQETKVASIKAKLDANAKALEAAELQNELERSMEGYAVKKEDLEAAQVKEEPKQLFANLGEQLQAIRQAAGAGAYVDPRLNQVNAAITGAGSNVGADGGFLIEYQFTDILTKQAFEQGQILSRVDRIPIGAGKNAIKVPYIDETSRTNGNRWGGVQVYWAAEGDAVANKKPKINKLETELQKLVGFAVMTEELLEDAPAMEAIFQQAFSEEFTFVAENSIIEGNGAGKPLGILQSAALVTVAKESGQAAATIVAENLYKMFGRIPQRNLSRSVWLINQDVWPALFGMTQTVGVGGIPVYLNGGNVAGAPFGTILGRPVIPTEHNATLGTVGDIILADLSQYMMIEKGGIQGNRSMHVYFNTGEEAFRWTMRMNGQPKWKTPITPAKGTNTLSPFVALATRA